MKIPSSEIVKRIRKLRALVSASGLGGVYLTTKEDVHYFSGFSGDDSAILLCGRKKYLLTDARYTEEAEKSAPSFEPICWKEHPATFAANLFKDLGASNIGVTENKLAVSSYKKLIKRGLKPAPIDTLVAKIRSIKSEWEVKQLRKAIRCIESAFEQAVKILSEKITEMDFRRELEYRMFEFGASAVAFETIVASGAHSSLPHAHARKKLLKKEVPIIVDFGAVVNGYNSDLTRTLFLGDMPKFWQECYNLVLRAQQAGIGAIAAGVALKNIDSAARNVFSEADCAKYFCHSLGHGIGLDVHEEPRLSSKSKSNMVLGNVVTVEPGLYYPGKGGIRIEDDVVVTRERGNLLSRLPKDVDSVIIAQI